MFACLGISLLPALSVDNRAGPAFFERHIRPIFVEHCYDCHSEEADEQKGGLLLDRASGWLEGGEMGKAVVPGDLDGSLLVAAVRRVDEDLEMPPKYPLDARDIALLEQWIRRGAPGPVDDMGETSFSRLGDQESLFEKANTHWAFQPVGNPEPPRARTAAWDAHPVDRFIDARLAEENLKPSPPADARTLIRRLHFDITGLPPSPEQVKTFTIRFNKDPASSIQHLVAELLASPHYGEHFARLWLDVARYADTADTYRPDTKTPHYYPHAFTYRDYVIEAFNDDKPFDQFIREQLAADLMDFAPRAPENAALGFIGVSPHRSMSGDFVDDVIDATSRGFLGLTAACSRCHDHKFEAIPTADYYSLYGVFGSIERPEPWDLDDFPVIEGYEPDARLRGDYEKKRAAIDAKIKEAGNKVRGGNNRSVAETIRQTDLAELLLHHDGAPARAMSVSDRDKPVDAFVFVRGQPGERGEDVTRHFLSVLDPEQTPFTPENSGRLDLANKITDRGNPLTARVFVNRVWGALMGSHLVETPSDFGFQGSSPSHPELLDWLASDFMANGWSLKHLVRTIVTSRVYGQRSTPRPELLEIDPENRLLARANTKRLQIEELRDSLLAVSGRIDFRMRGRSGPLWGEDHTHRRSVYGYINRFNLDPTLRAFDFPSPVQTQEKRTESIVPPQALFTMNAPFVIDQSKQLIQRLAFDDGVNREQRIDAIFNAILQRDADDPEHERISRFIDQQSKINNRQSEIPSPWPLVAQAIFMSNEFLYVD